MQILQPPDPWHMEDLRSYGSITLKAALVVMGFSAACSQLLVLRELLVVFHGNELTIGIILANWLILEAMGSFLSKEKASIARQPLANIALIQICISLSTLLAIIVVRTFRYFLDIPSGESLGIFYVFLVSIAVLFPIAFLDGALFPYGCRCLSSYQKREETPAYVYLLQATGASAAGIFLLFSLHRLSTIVLSSLLLLVNLISVTCYLSLVTEKFKFILTGLIIAFSFFLASNLPERLNQISAGFLWYEFKVEDVKNSKYSNIAVISQEDQYTFLVNGLPYAVSSYDYKVEELAHFPMIFHENPENILVIGSGAGGLLRELLKYQVVVIDYAEPDPLILETIKRFSPKFRDEELDSEKVKTHLIEGRLFLKKNTSSYDIVFVNLPLPSTLQINRYFTVEFFEMVKKRLGKKGILAISVEGSENFMSEELIDLNRTIYSSIKKIFPHVKVIIGNNNIFLGSSDEAMEKLTESTVSQRFQERKIEAGLINSRYIHYRLNKDRFGNIEKEISSSPYEKTNKDEIPHAVWMTMLYDSLLLSPWLNRLQMSIGKVSFSFYLAGVFIMLSVFVIFQAKNKSSPFFLYYAVGSSGFAGMFMNILLIFLFQIHYGNIYHYLGILTSIFMLGLALGAIGALKTLRINILNIEAAITSAIFTVFLFVASSPENTELILSFILFFMFVFGLLTGFEFPIAVKHSTREAGINVISASGRLYAVDVLGAFAGAIAVATVFIPLFGIVKSLVFLFMIKSAGLTLVFLGLMNKTPRLH